MIQLKVSAVAVILTESMLTVQTLLNCIDNSGAAVVECVNVLKRKSAATVGEFTVSSSAIVF